MSKRQYSVQQDHLPPGLGDTGRHEDWDAAFDRWLQRRGFHDELRQNKAGRGGLAAKRRQLGITSRNSVETRDGGCK